MDFRIYKDEETKTSQKSIKECTYEAKIYETEEDYNKGEPFSLGIYSDLKTAIKELTSCIDVNNYYAGNIIDVKTGQEILNFLD